MKVGVTCSVSGPYLEVLSTRDDPDQVELVEGWVAAVGERELNQTPQLSRHTTPCLAHHTIFSTL